MGYEPTTPERRPFGDFEIVREIGRGGMGIVFEAEQISLRRKVALKIMNSGLGISPKAIERFRREAEAAARLHHTNIVPIYTFGAHDGVPFYAMELIDGPSLDRVLRQFRQAGQTSERDAPTTTAAYAVTHEADCKQSPPPGAASTGSLSSLTSSTPASFDEVARMIADVADALEHAHRQGIIHRDIKPSNLLLSPEGRLSINDFGLARILEQPGVTVTGEFVGTPAYMSPEQIAAGRTPLDQRTDIYSLGATLYELLTRQRPFPGERREQVLAQILHKEPTRPRRLNRAIPLDLETICLKALEKDPDNRYQTAAALAADLRRFVQRFAIAARRVGPIGRLGKWIKRHPTVAAACATTLLCATVAGFFAVQSHQRSEELRQARINKALNDALLAGRGADFDAALLAVAEAEAAGASKGRLHFLRGYVAWHKDEHAKAIGHLEKAAELLPDDLAAKALLLLVYHNSGQMDKFYPQLNSLNELTARTPEDLMFRGRAIAMADPRKGLALLDEAVKKNDKLVLARVWRADAGSMAAETIGSIAEIERARVDVAAARQLLPDFKGAIVTSFYTHLRAVEIYDRHNLADKRDDCLKQAKSDAEALDADNQSRVRGALVLFYESKKDEEALLREVRGRDPRTLGYMANKVALHALVRDGDMKGARRLLDQTPTAGIEMIHMVERAVIEYLDNQPEAAYAAYQEARRISGRSRTRVELQVPLLLLGRKQEARQAHEANRRDPEFQKELALHANSPWREKLWSYTAGMITAQELEAAVSPSRWDQCEMWFFIGLSQFADGNQDAARAYFEKCVATNIWHFLEHRWARSLLVTMNRDPNGTRR